MYHFDAALVCGKISTFIRRAIDQPFNYTAIYLADLLPCAIIKESHFSPHPPFFFFCPSLVSPSTSTALIPPSSVARSRPPFATPSIDQPFNYAGIYLADFLPHVVRRIIYFDSDLIVIGDRCRPPLGHRPWSPCPRRPRVLSLQLHRPLLVRHLLPPHLLRSPLPPAVLLQHRRHGHGSRAVAHRRLHQKARVLDGDPEEGSPDLWAEFASAVPPSIHRRVLNGDLLFIYFLKKIILAML